MTLELTLEQLKELIPTYRTKCAYKVKSELDPSFQELRSCLMCNGFSSVTECKDYIDLNHLINLYEMFDRREVK